jgi:acetyl-CoA carboxylase biotin carboxyl carrier protein
VALTFKEILELIDKVSDRGLTSVEVETSGTRLRIEGRRSESIAQYPVEYAQAAHPVYPSIPPGGGRSPQASPLPAPALQVPEEDESGLHIITSPIVGTFYRSPTPEADVFCNVGDRVSKGKVLCIIEAMKLMNEIESDSDGTVAKIYPQNGQPIEYGEKLFAIRL